ncbi:MAG TPA: DUF1206 domain-containing protein [Longimicrobium sp.]|jgi:hypothetical protein|uniref:DUF1206 domain-containing protein n=1 Tax=Longimicrobium sp. TaxID=2029185 RepID=UPI002EDAEAB1
MANVSGVAGQAGAAARGAARNAAPWVERLARIGYAARGVVYVLLGIIAGQAALGKRGVTDQRGVFAEIVSRPGGKFMLGLVALGLMGYAVWRFVAASINPEGDSAGRRAAFAVSGVVHTGLALSAARMAMSSSSGGGGNANASLTAKALDAPGGQFLVAAAGLVIAGYGIQQIIHGWRAELDKRLDLSRLEANTRRAAITAARAGLAARGVVFILIGFFLVQAARHDNASETRGMDGALRALHNTAYGPWLLGLVALGLIGFGVTQLLNARYRRITPA